jgi:hypothetical protein
MCTGRFLILPIFAPCMELKIDMALKIHLKTCHKAKIYSRGFSSSNVWFVASFTNSFEYYKPDAQCVMQPKWVA